MIAQPVASQKSVCMVMTLMDNQKKGHRLFIHWPTVSCHILMSCVVNTADPVPCLTVAWLYIWVS